MESPIFTPDRIALNLPTSDGPEAIAQLAGLLTGDPAVLSAEDFLGEVLAREGISPTTLGNGVAVPHARTSHVARIVLAAGRCRDGIEFTPGAPPVHLIFLIGTPLDQVSEYLALVGGLTRSLKKPKVREALMAAETTEDFATALHG